MLFGEALEQEEVYAYRQDSSLKHTRLWGSVNVPPAKGKGTLEGCEEKSKQTQKVK